MSHAGLRVHAMLYRWPESLRRWSHYMSPYRRWERNRR